MLPLERRERLVALLQERKTATTEELAAELGTPARALPIDLSGEMGTDEYAAILDAEKPDVRVMVNAAGFGIFGSF